MAEIWETALPGLRFVRREGLTVRFILQQKWQQVVTTNNGLREVAYVWRDVPMEDENENKTPTDPAAT